MTFEAKRALRRRIRGLRAHFHKNEGREFGRKICHVVSSLDAFRVAPRVGLYWPVGGEVDLRPLIQSHPDKCFFLPKCLPDHALAFGPVSSGAKSGEFVGVVPGKYGIVEPITASRSVAELDFILVPGIAFDSRGNRLGQGAGYYDRALVGFPGATFGVAYPCQVIDDLIVEDHDVVLSGVVLPDGIWQNGCFTKVDSIGVSGG